MTALSLQGVSVCYDRRAVLSALDLDIARGSLVAVVGPNGAGKTTLLRTIAGELRPQAGQVVRAAGLAWLPQLAAVDRSFPIDVRTFVAMGLWSRIGAFRRLDRDDRARVDRALDVVGLRALGRQPIGALSGGQMQRVLFARLWLQDAALILMDEPFTAIDASTAADLLALIDGWHADGRTQLVVLHDLRLVRRHFPRTLLLSGDLVLYGPTAEVLAAPQLQRAGMARDPDNALAADGAPA